MNYKTPVSVLVVIHSAALEVLLIERAAHPGYWQSVTGSQEGDETLRETAVREVAEETGIVAAADALVDWQLSQQYEIFPQWRHRYAPGVTHNTEHVFSLCVARDTPIVLAPDEHRAWRWLPWQEAAEACFSWSNRDAILALPTRLATD
ncbi:dihydroneopterin triphosphate diphosphatase [Niveibacterium umoris]|uniref:dATP pyrophosphohydrolase n=1 Tax=Niveibacterium umoris TaxID=1193620 RepID=A0A840BL76_9RHOO|nr:dihydroneopterin triphosphate diphosphatase [Niveibacterium umoris]MBB4012308.1 dATP pyrophosphohydrolase [Niveibacterium umoris]